MFPEDLFAFVLEQLAQEVRSQEIPLPSPLSTDTFIARSVMQKAIRRGMTDLALRAAATLVTTDRRVLWRRLLVTALEDLGVGEIDLLARIVAASRDRAWRQGVGGEWRVIATLVRQACAGSRCQAANDLWNLALHDPRQDAFKEGLCETSLGDLLALMSDEPVPIIHRGIAVLMVLGEDAGRAAPTHIAADPGAVFAAFDQAGRFGHVVATYAEAFRLSGLALAPLSLCLWPSTQLQVIATQDDPITPVTWLGDIPGFALDQYTRGGQAAIRQYIHQSASWRDFAGRWDIPRANWTKAAGELLFRAEGAVVTNRRVWNAGGLLRGLSGPLGVLMPEAAVPEGMALIVRELAHIDRLRRLSLPIW